MIRITDISQIDMFLKISLKKDVFSNCFLLRNTFLEYIEKGELYYYEDIENQFILIDSGSYFKLYYVVKNLSNLFIIKNEKYIALEIVYSDKTYNESIIDYFLKSDFQIIANRKRMSVSYNNFNADCNNEIKTKFVEKKDIDLVKKMIDNNFEPYTSSIPTYDELLLKLKENQIIGYYEENELVGLLHFDINKKVTSIKQIVVHEKARGLGVAQSLLGFWKNIFDATVTFRLFVREDNVAARRLYEKAGFTYDGCQCLGLAKRALIRDKKEHS